MDRQLMMDPWTSAHVNEIAYLHSRTAGNQQTEVDIGIALATNCLGDNLEVCV